MHLSRTSLSVIIAVAFLVVPLAAQVRMPSDGGGSTRLVVRCNVDGSYTCANERCGQFCCEMPG
jgi:hypothetical protein